MAQKQRLVVLVATAAFSLLPSVMGAEPDLEKAMLRHRKRLLVLNTEWRHTGSPFAVRFDSFLRTLDQKTTARERKDWLKALSNSVHLGRQAHLFFRDTGYITEPAVVDILVAALRHSDREIRAYAVEYLTRNVVQGYLQARLEKIKEGLGAPNSDDEWRLYGRLPLSPKEKELIHGNPEVPTEVAARCGSQKAENALIASFEKSTDYYDKALLARKLGYAGSKKCALALMKGLRSNVAYYGAANERSIRLDILLALGHIYPTERIFTIDAIYLDQNSDEQFAQYRNTMTYIQEIKAFVLKHTGEYIWKDRVDIWFDRPTNRPILPAVP